MQIVGAIARSLLGQLHTLLGHLGLRGTITVPSNTIGQNPPSHHPLATHNSLPRLNHRLRHSQSLHVVKRCIGSVQSVACADDSLER